MRRLFYKWLWKTFYKRVSKVKKQYFRNNSYPAKECIRLQDIMYYLKTELEGDKS